MTEYQVYNVEFLTSDGNDIIESKVRVYHSIQHDPYTRYLTVSRSAIRRLEKLVEGKQGFWYVAPPTPYHPRAEFVEASK